MSETIGPLTQQQLIDAVNQHLVPYLRFWYTTGIVPWSPYHDDILPRRRKRWLPWDCVPK